MSLLSRKITGVILFLTLAGFYLWLGQEAYRHGFTSLENLFYTEKTLLALRGEPPRLENVGLVYPPLPFLLNMLLPGLNISGAVIGAILTACLLLRIGRSSFCPASTKVSFFFLLAGSFPVLFLFTQKPASAFFFALFTLANYFLLLFYETRYTQYLFLFGFSYGLCFLAAYESLFLLPYYLVVSAYLIRLKNPAYFFSMIMVAYFPLLFFLGAWAYLNWLFTEDPFHFLHSPYSYFLAYRDFLPFIAQTKGSIIQSFFFTVVSSLPFAGFYYLLLPFLKKEERPVAFSPYFLIYVAPFLLLFFQVYCGLSLPGVFKLSLFVFFGALFVSQLKSRLILKIMPFLLTIALIWCWWAAWESPAQEEKTFARFLAGRSFSANLGAYQEVAKEIKEANGKVLLDDSQLYPVVAIDGFPRRYILPYNYEFDLVLSHPSSFVEYVVVYSDPAKDRVAGVWPQAVKGFLPGFYPLFAKEKIIVFKRWF